jgi:enoyl-CoA hydratase
MLNRPGAMNALNALLVKELDEAIEIVAADSAIRAAIISGDKNFAAGADIKDMVELNPEQAKTFVFNKTFSKIENLSIPTIAAISGYALGGGLELAMVCDLRIAGPDAKLGLPEINLGIFPGAGGTQRLPRLVGVSRAKELIFQGVILDAEKAHQYGLVNEISENPLERALKLAEKLAAKAPIALKLAKKAISLSPDVSLSSGLELETLAWGSLFATEDQREGMKAFIEKRKATFKGK